MYPYLNVATRDSHHIAVPLRHCCTNSFRLAVAQSAHLAAA